MEDTRLMSQHIRDERCLAPQNYQAFFRQRLIAGLAAWRDWLENEDFDDVRLRGKEGQIVKQIQLGLEMAEDWSTALALLTAWNPYLNRRGAWELGHSLWDQALTQAIRRNDSAREVQILVQLARLAQKQCQPHRVVHYYRRVIHLARQIGDVENEARACSNLGYLFTEQGQWWRAEILNRHALTIFDRLAHAHGLAHTRSHLGLLYLRQHRWGEAEKHLSTACLLWHQHGDQQGLLRGFINMGAMYNEKGRFDRAIAYLERAYNEAKEISDPINQSAICTNLSRAYLSLHEVKQALHYNQEATHLAEQHQDAQGLLQAWNTRSLIHARHQEWAEALRLLQCALDLAEQQRSRVKVLEIRLDMIEIQLRAKQHRRACREWRTINTLLINSPYRDRFLKRTAHYQQRLQIAQKAD